jgi:diguanylate cyclase (GGDEF)-like protein
MGPSKKPGHELKSHSVLLRWGLPLVLLAVCIFAYANASQETRTPVGVLIVIPVLVAAWLNGRWAWIIYLLGIVTLFIISLLKGESVQDIVINRGWLLEALALLLVMGVAIELNRTTQVLTQRTAEQQALLEKMHSQAAFLTLLGDIISTALEAADTTSLLQVLVNRTGELFGAHDCYITFWNEENRQTLPQVAYGVLRENYQQVHQFQNGEYTLTAAVMDAGRAIAIENMKETQVLSRNVAEEFPNLAALGLPLVAGELKLGALILGFNTVHVFSPDEIERGELAARQISLAITKAVLLEEEQKRARQLDTLLALAIESTEAGTEEELIGRATRLIGKKLYPDNFGIMLLDEKAGTLLVHPSYHTPDVESPDISITQGICGRVARTGHASRVGDVRRDPDYLSIDPEIQSELCVPLKIGERLIGVINVESDKLNAFSLDDENLLSIMAGQLATSMDRLRASDESYRQAIQLGRANSLIRVLAQVGTRAASAVDPESVLQTLGAELGKLDLMCLVSLVTPDGKELSIRYTSIAPEILRLAERLGSGSMQDYHIPLAETDDLNASTKAPILLEHPVEVASRLLKGLPTRFVERIFTSTVDKTVMPVCILPLRNEGSMLGYLWMWGASLRESDLPTMSIFANQVASALQNANLLVRVQRLAVTDELTGLFNRRHFFHLAGAEFERAIKNGNPMSIIIIDLDYFKQFNDKYGHLVGDQVLRGVARLMASCVRGRDIIGRYGGEEFSIALPGTDVEAAGIVIQRFLTHVSNVPIPTDAGDLSVHLSLGIAGLTPEVNTLNELINRADQAMYQAKNLGGDQFAIYY